MLLVLVPIYFSFRHGARAVNTFGSVARIACSR